MKTKLKEVSCFLIIMLILVIGCKREPFQFGNKIGNITYSGKTIFLDAAELSVLKDVSAGTLVFSSQPGKIGNIRKDNILAMGVSEKTPYGLLRKVVSIQKNGSSIEIKTDDATLEDAIIEGTISLNRKLLEKNFSLGTKIDGVLVKGPTKSFDGLAITMDKVQLYSAGNQTAWLDGSIGVSPEIKIEIKIETSQIKSIEINTILTKIDEVSVSSNSAFSGKNEVTLANFIHVPIVLDSIVFVPMIKIKGGFDRSINCQVSAGVRQDRVITSNLKYENLLWTPAFTSDSPVYDYINPQITTNSDLKIFSGPEMTILLFGVPIQIVSSNGYYELKADKTWQDWWKLGIGIDGTNLVKSDILGLDQDFTYVLNIQPSQIGSANFPNGSKSK